MLQLENIQIRESWAELFPALIFILLIFMGSHNLMHWFHDFSILAYIWHVRGRKRVQHSSEPFLAILNLPHVRAVNLSQSRELVLDAALIFSIFINPDSLIYFLWKPSFELVTFVGASLLNKAASFVLQPVLLRQALALRQPLLLSMPHLLRMTYLLRIVMHSSLGVPPFMRQPNLPKHYLTR